MREGRYQSFCIRSEDICSNPEEQLVLGVLGMEGAGCILTWRSGYFQICISMQHSIPCAKLGCESSSKHWGGLGARQCLQAAVGALMQSLLWHVGMAKLHPGGQAGLPWACGLLAALGSGWKSLSRAVLLLAHRPGGGESLQLHQEHTVRLQERHLLLT